VAYLAFDGWAAWRPEAAQAASPGAVLLGLALHVLLSIHVLRLVLEGEGAVPPFGLVGWGRRQWRYLGGIGLQTLVVAMAVMTLSPVALLGTPGIAVCALVSSWVAGRAALLLPPLALDQPWDARAVWARGRGAGFALAFIYVGLPLLQTLLIYPLVTSDLLALQMLGSMLALLASAWSLAALGLAWVALAPSTAPVEGVRAAPGIRVLPDAVRGLLELQVRGRFEARDFGHAAAGDGLVGFHGRLRGLVLDVQDEAWDPAGAGERVWDALDTLLSHLGLVRIHHEHLERVAVLGDGGWSPYLARLGKHFGHAELRLFPPLQAEAARCWAAGEAGA
jgi:hypothetical protein